MWQTIAINTIRSMIGDIDSENYEYTDQKILNLFMSSAWLVMLDINMDVDYEIDIANSEITPDPSDDKDFIALVALRSYCVLLSSELRIKSSKKVTVSDGPSRISVDNSDLVSSLRDTNKKAADKYEKAIFQYNAGKTVAGLILGPYSPGSHYIRGGSHRNGH